MIVKAIFEHFYVEETDAINGTHIYQRGYFRLEDIGWTASMLYRYVKKYTHENARNLAIKIMDRKVREDVRECGESMYEVNSSDRNDILDLLDLVWKFPDDHFEVDSTWDECECCGSFDINYIRDSENEMEQDSHFGGIGFK